MDTSKQASSAKLITCEFCKKQKPVYGVRSRTQRFCSSRCRGAWQRAQHEEVTKIPQTRQRIPLTPRASDRIFPCKFCHQLTRVRTGVKYEHQEFSSKKCRGQWRTDQVPRVTKTCMLCGNPFTFLSLGQAGDSIRKCCHSPCKAHGRIITKTCAHCEKEFSFLTQGPAKDSRRNFCSRRCVRLHHPPLDNPESLAKMRRTLAEPHTFLGRGGHSRTTKPQELLAAALNLPMEYVINLSLVKHLFKHLPRHGYAVDLAHVESKTAIEVDGRSHSTKKWQYLDRKKTEILSALGWSVLRFGNGTIISTPESVVSQIRAYIACRSQTTTTSSPAAS